MLSDFFRINLPYGIAKNEIGQWMAFNREYLPLGMCDETKKQNPGSDYQNLNVYEKYANLSEKILFDLAGHEDAVQRNNKGDIIQVWLYNDSSNPVNQSKDKPELWESYFKKIKKLSKLKVHK